MTTNTKTPAMRIQEYTVRKKISPPEYDLIYSSTGTHENEFHFKVTVGCVQAIGVGRSKQVAKHDAAFKAIELLSEKGLYDEQTPTQDFKPQMHRNEPEHYGQGAVNSIGQLNDICCENKLPFPRFNEISDVGPPHCRQFTWECELSSIKTQSTANTKKQAKQIAARLMLERIKEILPELKAATEDARNAITDSDELKDRYLELSFFNVIPNKSAKVDEFEFCFVKLMAEKHLKYEDFTDLLEDETEESFKTILEKLGLEYKFITIQECPNTVLLLTVSTDTPFSNIGVGKSFDEAKCNTLKDTFEILKIYMQIKMC